MFVRKDLFKHLYFTNVTTFSIYFYFLFYYLSYKQKSSKEDTFIKYK